MEQQAPAPRSFYIRMAVLLFAILLPVDWIGMTLAVRQFFISGPTVDLIFGFEVETCAVVSSVVYLLSCPSKYSVLLIAALATGLRFAVHVYTQHHEVAPGREHMFLFYIDLGSGMLEVYPCHFPPQRSHITPC